LPTIGDVLFLVRSAIPDLPPTLPPVIASVTVQIMQSTLPTGTYNCKVTQRNPWGETLPLSETLSLSVGPSTGIQVNTVPLPGVTAIRAYITMPGGASGTECQYVESTVVGSGAQGPVINFAPTAAGSPPTRSTAYMMDSDGVMFGASTIYGWLNEGLMKLSRAVGGILDYAGVPTVAGQPLYVTPGQWTEISDVWYGGYWVQGGKRAEFFRRNAVTASILSQVTVSVFTEKQVIEVSYQPDRNSGVTPTTADMAATDTSVQIGDISQFLLPFGFAQLSNPSVSTATEIVAYSSLSGNTMGGLIRALGSSTAQVWSAGSTVTELSLFWSGKRLFTTKYFPGQAATTLAAPAGWDSILTLYMLAQAKKAEQDIKTAKELSDQFFQEAQEWYRANKGVARFIQVGGGSGLGVFDGSIAGGVIIP
jgi:hypothetical protein